MEKIAQLLERGQHSGYCLVLNLLNRLAGTTGLGVNSQRIGQLVRKAEHVHNQTARLIAINSVNASNGLHQVVAGQWLV
ncbi:Uncharacterised protein [Burkholderia pseudomallei]|nr:Uncharacterised protein [Burkholderia pseudomallei]